MPPSATASTPSRVPALGAEGWFTVDDEPTLIGSRCGKCGTYVFPKTEGRCPNPTCDVTELSEIPLSRRGTLWSYTDARYQPPPPYVVPTGEFEPFAIAAVELVDEGLIVLGQVAGATGVHELTVGQEMEVVVDTLFSDDDHEYLVWKWAPVDQGGR